MSLRPENRMVVFYDFLFSDRADKGAIEGEYHPCMILKVYPEDEHGDRKVIVTPISHSAPKDGEEAIEMPPRVAEHVGLDKARMWIKPQEMNAFTWPADQLPYGLKANPQGAWSYPNPVPLRSAIPARDVAQAALDHAQSRVIDRNQLMQRYERQIEMARDGKPEHEHGQADD